MLVEKDVAELALRALRRLEALSKMFPSASSSDTEGGGNAIPAAHTCSDPICGTSISTAFIRNTVPTS